MKQVILEIRFKKVGGPLRFWGGKRRGPTATNIAESPSNLRGYALNLDTAVSIITQYSICIYLWLDLSLVNLCAPPSNRMASAAGSNI